MAKETRRNRSSSPRKKEGNQSTSNELFFKNPHYIESSEARRSKKTKSLKQIMELMNTKYGNDSQYLAFNYNNVDAAPSLRPRSKYCDITGLPAEYTDPQTGLHYHSAAVYQFIRSLSPEAVQHYLRLRNAHTIVK